MATLTVTDSPYNAAGDGSTDDSGAIQSAIDDASDGDTIYFPEPDVHYNMYPGSSSGAEAVVLSGNSTATNITLKGENSNTVLKIDPATDVNHSMFSFEDPDNHSVTMKQLVLDGNRSNVANQDFPTFLIKCREIGANGPADHLFEDIILQNSVGHGCSMQYGGITMRWCTSRYNGRHGFVFSTEVSNVNNPVPEIYNTLSRGNSRDRDGFYNLDCTTGKLYAHDCVLIGGNHGFKVSDNAIKLTAERLRVRGGTGAVYRSTGENEQTDVIFGDIVGRNMDGYFRMNNPEKYVIQDGTALVMTNCSARRNAQVYITESADLDASNASIYSNRANSAYGLSSDTTGSAIIDNYYHYQNDDGALGSTKNLTINNQEVRDKTDIDGVPYEEDVGAFNNNQTEVSDNIRTLKTDLGEY